MKLGDFLTSINLTKENLFDVFPDEAQKNYVPFIVGRSMGHFQDTVLLANIINVNPAGYDNKLMHYDFLLNTIRKRRRFKPWPKKESSVSIETIMQYYTCNENRAEEMAEFINEEDINQMKSELDPGGRK